MRHRGKAGVRPVGGIARMAVEKTVGSISWGYKMQEYSDK